MVYKLKHYEDHQIASYGGIILNVNDNSTSNYICILNLLEWWCIMYPEKTISQFRFDTWRFEKKKNVHCSP
jgi:hypothetical protein